MLSFGLTHYITHYIGRMMIRSYKCTKSIPTTIDASKYFNKIYDDANDIVDDKNKIQLHIFQFTASKYPVEHPFLVSLFPRFSVYTQRNARKHAYI